ncbi:MAG: hypothetical protein QJR08_03785 [Bacillota bacterium]|nr:hypothetical protein [Bacillota bacterium]
MASSFPLLDTGGPGSVPLIRPRRPRPAPVPPTGGRPGQAPVTGVPPSSVPTVGPRTSGSTLSYRAGPGGIMFTSGEGATGIGVVRPSTGPSMRTAAVVQPQTPATVPAPSPTYGGQAGPTGATQQGGQTTTTTGTQQGGQTTTTTTQTGGDILQNVANVVTGYIGQFVESSRQSDAEAQAIAAAMLDQLKSTFQQTLAGIQAYFQAQFGQNAPALDAINAAIDAQAEKARQALLADMSRRGLLQSGILAKVQLDLAQQQLTQKQQAYASYYGNIISAMNQAIVSAYSQYAQAVYGVSADVAMQRIQATLARPSQALQAANLGLQALGTAQDILNANRQFGLQEAQVTGLYQGRPTLAMQQFQADTALRQAQLQEQARQFAQQMGLDWARLRQDQQQFLTDLMERRAEFQANLGSASVDMTPQAVSKIIGVPPDQRSEYVRRNLQAWVDQGVDPVKLKQALDALGIVIAY